MENLETLAITKTTLYKGVELGFDWFIDPVTKFIYADNKQRNNLHGFGSLRHFINRIILQEEFIYLNKDYKESIDEIINNYANTEEKEKYKSLNWK